jgi:hypothetical protein
MTNSQGTYGYRWYVAADPDNDEAEGLDLVVVADYPGMSDTDITEVRCENFVTEWDDDEDAYVFSDEQLQELRDSAYEIARDLGWVTRGIATETEELLEIVTSRWITLGPDTLVRRLVALLREVNWQAREAVGADE